MVLSAFAFVSVLVAELPSQTSEAWAQDTTHTQRAQKSSRKRKRRKRRKRKRVAKHKRYYAAASFTPLTLSGCFEGPVCPTDSGVTWRGILGLRGAVGYRWDVLALGMRYGAYGYSTHDPELGRSLEGTFGELLGELRIAPVGTRSRWDPYLTVGAGAMIASVTDTTTDTSESVYVPGGAVGGGLDYFFSRTGAVGLAGEVFAIANRGSTQDVAKLWNVRLQVTAYWGGRKRRKPRRPSRRPPRQPQPRPKPKPTR